jgi:hypothetical protein
MADASTPLTRPLRLRDVVIIRRVLEVRVEQVAHGSMIRRIAAFSAPSNTFGRRPSQRQLYAVLDVTGRCDWVLLVGAGITMATHIVPLLERSWPAIREVAAQLFSHSQGQPRRRDQGAWACPPTPTPPQSAG